MFRTMTAAATEYPAHAPRSARPPIRSPLTLRELLTPVFHHKRLVLLAFLLPVVAAFCAALLAHSMYSAESRLLILLGDDYVFRGDVAGETPGLSFDRAQIVQAEIQILSDRDLHAAAIRQIGLAKVYPGLADTPEGMERALIRFDKDLVIENVPQSNVVDLRLRNRSPTVAADTLNTLISLYIDRRRQIFQQSDPVQVATQRDQLRQQLLALDNQISDFATQHNFGDYDQALAAAQAQQANLANEVDSLDQQYATHRGRAAKLGDTLRRTPSSVQLYSEQSRSQQLDAVTGALVTLQNQRREAAAKYTDTYPLVADLDKRIAALQAQLKSVPQQQPADQRIGANPTYQVLTADLAGAQGDAAGLAQGRVAAEASLRAANARLRELTAIGPQYREMVRNRGVIESAYSDLAKRAEDTGVQDILSRAQANVRVIQRATPPVQGKAGRLLILAAGLLLGVVFAAAAVLFAAAFSEEMITPHDVEQKLDVPVVLSIPWREAASNSGRGSRKAYLSLDDTALITRLATSLHSQPCSAIELIAADPGAGVSTLALELAFQAAGQAGRKVLLIDVEPARGKGLISRLEAAGARLRGAPDQRVRQVEGSNLSVTRPIGAHDLQVDESQWEGLIRRARQAYDLIIVDAPAATHSSAGVVISPFVDMSLLVVEAERTRAAVARNLIERVDAAGGQIIGAIFNKRRFPIPPSIYAKL